MGMADQRNWKAIALAIELLAAVLMFVSPWFALPVALIGIGVGTYGVWPAQSKRLISKITRYAKIIGLSAFIIIIATGTFWYFVNSERAANTLEPTLVSSRQKHPLRLIYPGPGYIRTQILSLEGDGQKIVYKNFHLIGAQNPRSSKKSIKGLRLKMWLFDAPGDLKLSGEDKTIVDLNPGDIVFFEVGYFLSRSLFGVPIGGTALPQKEFEILYHNARQELEAFRFKTGKGKSTYTIFLKQLKNPTEPTSVTVQFSANDTPPLIVDIFVYWDAKHGVRLEALVKD